MIFAQALPMICDCQALLMICDCDGGADSDSPGSQDYVQLLNLTITAMITAAGVLLCLLHRL